MASDVSIKSYHVKHRLQLNPLLSAAKKVADYAVQNKNSKKLLTSRRATAKMLRALLVTCRNGA